MPIPDLAFCTIVTQSHWAYARALGESVKKHHPEVTFIVLVADASQKQEVSGVTHFVLNDLKAAYPEDYQKIAHYENDPQSNLRWALKPLFLKFLLNKQGFKKVIFTDPDTFYYHPVSFVWDFLDHRDIALTPHWRSIEPAQDASNFTELMSGGLFNAGFIACNRQATDLLDWWLRACAYRMEKENGFYVDQAYLNLLTVYFPERLHIITHKGCNLANWNRMVCKRENVNGKVLINGTDPVVFIHFTQATIHFIENGKDGLLQSHLDKYKEALKNFGLYQNEVDKKQKKTTLWNLIKLKS